MQLKKFLKASLWLLSLVLITSSLTIAIAAPKYADSSKPIYVSKRQSRFSIRLPANQTTGYRWYLTEYNAALIKPIRYRYKKTGNKLIGAGGYATWTFAATSSLLKLPQMTIIKLIYAQPWNWQQGKLVTLQIFSQ